MPLNEHSLTLLSRFDFFFFSLRDCQFMFSLVSL
jgi:hypothetical protein